MGEQTATVPLPTWFDKTKHSVMLQDLVARKLGAGWTVTSIDTTRKVAYASQTVDTTEVTYENQDSIIVSLRAGTPESEGPKVADRLEKQYPGFRLTQFKPALNQARLTRMDDKTYGARRSIASVLGVKPWLIQVTPRDDGGYHAVLSSNYTSAKYFEKLQQVVFDDIGQFGWIVDVNPATLECEIVPSDPPILPDMMPVDLDAAPSRDTVPFGVGLGRDNQYPNIVLDFNSAHGVLVSGLPGGGKSVVVNSIIVSQLKGGAKLAIVDDKSKAVDFEWCKPYVIDGGWGCGSLAAAVATTGLVREEGGRRANQLKQSGYKNWLDMPEADQFAPLLLVVDEATALMVMEPKLAGLPKDNPVVVEITNNNALRALIYSNLNHIIQELRFVGVRVVLASQIMNASSGLPPTFKDKFGHRLLLGATPSPAQKNQAFQDPAGVPDVPDHVAADKKQSKGAGSYSLEGAGAGVFKGRFLSTTDAADYLGTLGLPTSARPDPTPAEIARLAPIDTDGVDGPAPESRLVSEGGFGQAIGNIEQLRGAARAAHDLALAEAMAKNG